MTEPVLIIADITKDYILQTDASDYALGAVLLQEDLIKLLHPIAYASRSLNKAERNYGTTEREALALIWGLEHFKTFCEGHRYTCLTDHTALTYVVNNKESTNQRVARWVLRLQPYDLKLKYLPGKQNSTADLMSRIAALMHEERMNALLRSLTTAIDGKQRKAISAESNKRRYIKRMRKNPHTFEEEFVVEKIVNKRLVPNTINEFEYEVQWKNYLTTTWEPLHHLKNAMQEVLKYEDEVAKTRLRIINDQHTQDNMDQ